MHNLFIRRLRTRFLRRRRLVVQCFDCAYSQPARGFVHAAALVVAHQRETS